MARETKVQREERIAREQAEYLNEITLEYPYRLMKVLEMASTLHFDITVKDSLFNIETRNDYGVFILPYTLTDKEYYNELLNLESLIIRKLREREEAEQLYMKKQEILSKLSPEEKKILGI